MKKESQCNEVGLAKLGGHFVLQMCLAKSLGRGSVHLSKLSAQSQTSNEVEIRSL